MYEAAVGSLKVTDECSSLKVATCIQAYRPLHMVLLFCK